MRLSTLNAVARGRSAYSLTWGTDRERAAMS